MQSRAALFLVWILTASAQPVPQAAENTPLGAPTGTVRFGATTQLVVENVIVNRKDGKPMAGLTASDFDITEDGQPQKIAVFEFQTLKEEAAPATPSLKPPSKDIAPSGESPQPAVRSVAATHIAAERPGDVKYRDRRLMVLFFDLNSMPIQDQIRAQNAALKFVRIQMTRSDLVAIMTFSSDMKVVEDFASSGEFVGNC